MQDKHILGNFVRLMDYMMVESLLILLVEQVENLLEILSNSPFIVSKVRFGDLGIEFSPNEDDFQKV